MLHDFTSFDECTLEQLAADERADAIRNEAEEYERALFLSEATAAATRPLTEEEVQAEYRRQMLSQDASDLMRMINRHVPACGGQWHSAIKCLIRLASELNADPLLPPARQTALPAQSHSVA